jgi:hypothetical protein
MKVSELASAVGYSESFIKKQIREQLPTKMENGKETNLTQDEVKLLLKSIFKSEIVVQAMIDKMQPITAEQQPITAEQVGRPSLFALAQQVAQQGNLLAEMIGRQERSERIELAIVNKLNRLKSKPIQIEDTSHDRMLLDLKQSLERISLKVDKDEDELMDDIFGKWSYLQK